MFTFLQLAHAGDAHAMNATVLMGWVWGGAVFMFFELAHAGHGVGVGVGGDVNVQLKSHTYVMLRSTPTLT